MHNMDNFSLIRIIKQASFKSLVNGNYPALVYHFIKPEDPKALSNTSVIHPLIPNWLTPISLTTAAQKEGHIVLTPDRVRASTVENYTYQAMTVTFLGLGCS